ncbi:MAG: hypothetical protein JKY53_13770 [Flavobacteriales bacterium]|nr:hypothetical protein [Flavobacteriales bacterium]
MKKKNNENNLPIHEGDGFFKKPIVRFVLIAGTVYGAIYLSRYFINASAETVRACKNFRNACVE